MATLLLHTNQPADALAACKRALADRKALAEAPGASEDARRGLADTFDELGILLWEAHKSAEAVPEYRAAIAIQQRLTEDNPTAEFRQVLANSHSHLGLALQSIGKHAEAEAEIRTAAAIDQKLVDDHPAVAVFRRNLAMCRFELGTLFVWAGRQSQGEAELRTAVASLQKLVAENPVVINFRMTLAVCQRNLGIVLLQTGRPEEAQVECRTAISMLDELARENRTLIGIRYQLILALNNLGDAVRPLGRAAEARGIYDRAITLAAQIRRGPTDPEPDYFLPRMLWRRGLTLRDLGDPAGAAAEVRRALAMCEGLPPQSGFEFETACCHAALTGLAGRPGSGVAPAEGEAAAVGAMECLSRAVARGYRNANEIRIESALEPLRDRPEFKKLMAELEKNAAGTGSASPQRATTLPLGPAGMAEGNRETYGP